MCLFGLRGRGASRLFQFVLKIVILRVVIAAKLKHSNVRVIFIPEDEASRQFPFQIRVRVRNQSLRNSHSNHLPHRGSPRL
jgi:hypothetical protein